MGPAELAPGQGIDVRPHPHIGLATVTYLFAGTIVHRDSLGSVQAIEPGAVNWMTAGCGIVHSERSDMELRKRRQKLYGIQIWIALPKAREETEPSFTHYAAASLPVIEGEGKTVRIIAGSLYGQASPVTTFSPLFYADATLQAGASLALENKHEERAIYLLEGNAVIQEQVFEPGRLLVFSPAMKSGSRQPRALACCFSAAIRWTAYVTFGGILFRARASGSSRRRAIGKQGASRRFLAMLSLFRCPKDRNAPLIRLRIPPLGNAGHYRHPRLQTSQTRH
jgi:Pirin-related protein